MGRIRGVQWQAPHAGGGGGGGDRSGWGLELGLVAGAGRRVPVLWLAGRQPPPLPELPVAVATRAAGHAAGVEIGVLVEWDLEGAVLVAKDVAALAAVVAAREVAEVSLAGRVIANGGLVVRLQHTSC